jgi:hypothetical protein
MENKLSALGKWLVPAADFFILIVLTLSRYGLTPISSSHP